MVVFLGYVLLVLMTLMVISDVMSGSGTQEL